MRLCVVLPTYNERENIENVLKGVFSAFAQANIDGYAIVVDDGSPDGTAKIAKGMGNEKITVLEREKKMGLGSAYVLGFKKALEMGADAVMEMDSDLSHDPKDIPRFAQALKDSDAVIGSRRINGGKIVGWNFYRHLISWGGTFIGTLIAGLKIADITSGYRAYKADVIKSIDLSAIRSEGYAFQLEILFRAVKKGFSVKEIPITFVDRRYGKSKISEKDVFEFFARAIALRLGK